MRRLTVALACVAMSFAPGCGGDDDEAPGGSPTPIPTLPESSPEPDVTTDQDALTEEQPAPAPAPEEDQGSGGAEAPPPVPDSPENDIPPPEGSPAERFEQFCAEKPGACGQ